MDESLESFLPHGIPCRLHMCRTTAMGNWAFLTDLKMSFFVPAVILAFHKGVLDGISTGLFTRENCGIYTSLIHTWMSFGISPQYIFVPMEMIKEDGKIIPSAKPQIQLKQQNEIGTAIGNVSFSLADAVVFSEILNTPIILSEASVASIGVKIEPNGGSIESQIMKAVADFESGSPNNLQD